MEEFFEPEFDFSQLNASELQEAGHVTYAEILQVYKSGRSRVYDVSDYRKSETYHYCVGCSFKSRFLFLALDIRAEKYRFLDVKLANEYEIEKFWCKL